MTDVITGEVVETKKYEDIEFNGKPARLYPNGDIRNERGQLLKKPEYIMQHTITPELASAYGKRRKEKILEAIEQGLMDITKAQSPAEAISYIVRKRAQVAMNDEGRAGNDAAKIVLAAVDALQDRKSEEVKTERHEYAIDEETLALLEELAERKRE